MRDNVTQDSDVAFLEDAAVYFENRSTGGEDRAHWANGYNAANCRRIAHRLASTTAQTEAVQALVDALEGFVSDLTNDGRNAYTSLTISHDGLNARIKQARAALAAHRESQP